MEYQKKRSPKHWTSVISLAFVFFLSSCGKIYTNCEISPAGLVSWWNGNQVSGLSALDQIGGNTGTLDTSILFSPGKRSTAFIFDGAASTISIPSSSSLQLNRSMSISLWLKGSTDPRSINALRTVLSEGSLRTPNSLIQVSNWQGIDLSLFSGTYANGTTAWSALSGLGNPINDSRYIYFNNSTSVIRFDPRSEFSSPSSWQAVNIKTFSGTISDGITNWTSMALGYGKVFDGRYLYLGGNKIVRFDTQGDFLSQTSWQGINIGSFSGTMADGTSWTSMSNIQGSVFDGRYVILNSAGSGIVVRYDIQGTFTDQNSWQGANIAAFSGNATDGSTPWSSFTSNTGGSFDGRYVYLNNYLGKMARFDTQGVFTSVSSWRGVKVTSFPGNATDGVTPWNQFLGFQGSPFDGRYFYSIPWCCGPRGKVLRYDTQSSSFESASSWQGVDIAAFPGNATDGTSWTLFKQYYGGSFDGRYLYMTPSAHGKITRFDTSGNFTSSSSWEGVDLGGFPGTATDQVTLWSSFATGGLSSAAFDGRYLYMPSPGSKVARFDAWGNQSSFQLDYSALSTDGFGGALPATSFFVNTSTGSNSAQSHLSLSPSSWHHVAVSYDGSILSLYIDGALVSSQAGSGAINSTSTGLMIGNMLGGQNYFNGAMENIQIYNKAISATDVQNLYSLPFCK